MSSDSSSTTTTTTITFTTRSTTKRLKNHHHNHQILEENRHQILEGNRHQIQEEIRHHHQSLLPGLPDHIAQLILSLVHPSVLYSVCHSWRRLIYSSSFPPFLSIYAFLISKQTTSALQTHLSNPIKFSSFDPIALRWVILPPPPPEHPPLRFLLRHPSFISRNIPIQSVTVSGKLVLLAATADHFVPALSRPIMFDPLARNWSYGPPLAAPRRWCATGVSNDVVYVASGIGSHFSSDIARSIEKWDLGSNKNGNKKRWKWEKMGCLKDGKFSREAVDAIGWRDKLCMVNVKGDAAKEGIIYDVNGDVWEEMPDGMLQGWKGPAAAMDEETIYVVDESKGVLKKYDPEIDMWVVIVENEMFKGAQCIAAGGGRVCVVCGGGVNIVVVDVVVSPPRLWVVDTPPGYEALAMHILPRMSQ